MNNRKSILCLFLLFLLSLGSLSVNAQTVSKVFKEQTLKTVLKEIESQTGLSIIYQKNEINENKKVNATFENTPVVEALSSILDKSLEVNLKNKMIVISKKGAIKNNNQIKQKTITGQIADDKGEPVIGASIIIEGTSQGTITNIDGEYTLANVPENSMITISFVGYKSLTFAANDKTLANITLKEDSELIDEVVVVGYGVQKKRDVTGAMASVDAAKIASVPVTSASEALQGRASGVLVSQDNWAPGTSPTVLIRGKRSINASNEPLYVVDGVPITGGLREISPSDIASMEVLKDASATAIYGSRGANGVVLITTKQGKDA